MKIIRRLLCVALAVSLLCVAAFPALAEIQLIPESTTMYLNSRNSTTLTATRKIAINGIDLDSKITNPKSSKPAVLSIAYLTLDEEHLVEFPGDTVDHILATLSVRLHKPGKSTVSVKVDGKTCKTKLNVAQYVNPIKSFVITSLSGKNLKSQFKTSGSAVSILSSNTKAGQVKLTAASGWRIRKIGFIGSEDTINHERRTGATTVKLPIPAMKKGNYYAIAAVLQNIATGGVIDTMYMLK
jgi:hypothetical protein